MTADSPMRAMIAEDAALLRDGISRLLAANGIDVIQTFADADGLVDAAVEAHPDLVLLDVRMPPTHTDEGIVAAIEIRRRTPSVAVLVLSQYVEEHYASELLSSGVTDAHASADARNSAPPAAGVGYLLKDRVMDVDDFVGAVRRVVAGETVIDPEVVQQLLGRSRRGSELDRLTPREREVLAAMAEGLSNSGIADQLVISIGAVEKHISNVFTKLDLHGDEFEHRRVRAVLSFLRSTR